MRHLLAVLLLNVMIVLTATAQKQPYFTKAFSKSEFATRRAEVMKSIGSDSIAVIRGNEGMPSYVAFRQGGDFFYLTGVEAPGATLVLDGGSGKETLFLPPKNEQRERSEGALLAPDDVSRELTGISDIRPVGDFTTFMGRLSSARQGLYAPMAPQVLEAMSRDLAVRYNQERIDDPWDGRSSREMHFISLLHERLPGFQVKNLTPILDRMRLIKSKEEIEVLRRSSQLAVEALVEAMRSTQPGMYEYELDALGRFIYLRNGADGMAYYALVADGVNAYQPHYHAGQSQITDGHLVLMDFAPSYHYYNSDVTRMWPANGRFSPEQRDLYNFYLGCYRAILNHIRPNVPISTIGTEAAKDMEALLARTKFSNEKSTRAASKFVSDYKRRASLPNFMLGHWVGLSTHDVGGVVSELKPGMVFTIEPALTVPEDETYIRLEDMLLVTERGVQNMSASAPMEIEAIEKLMKERGLLEQYPRSMPHYQLAPTKAER